MFNKSKVGLMLIKEGSKVVVKDVSNDEYKDRIHPGYVFSFCWRRKCEKQFAFECCGTSSYTRATFER